MAFTGQEMKEFTAEVKVTVGIAGPDGQDLIEIDAYSVRAENAGMARFLAQSLAAQLYWDNATVEPQRVVMLDGEPYLRGPGADAKDSFAHDFRTGATPIVYQNEQDCIAAMGRQYTAAIEAMPRGGLILHGTEGPFATLTRVVAK